MPSDTYGARRIIESLVWVVFSNCVVSNFRFVKLFIWPWLMTQPFTCSPTVMSWEHFNNQTSISFKRFYSKTCFRPQHSKCIVQGTDLSCVPEVNVMCQYKPIYCIHTYICMHKQANICTYTHTHTNIYEDLSWFWSTCHIVLTNPVGGSGLQNRSYRRLRIWTDVTHGNTVAVRVTLKPASGWVTVCSLAHG